MSNRAPAVFIVEATALGLGASVQVRLFLLLEKPIASLKELRAAMPSMFGRLLCFVERIAIALETGNRFLDCTASIPKTTGCVVYVDI